VRTNQFLPIAIVICVLVIQYPGARVAYSLHMGSLDETRRISSEVHFLDIATVDILSADIAAVENEIAGNYSL
jgi:hypothetical protein